MFKSKSSTEGNASKSSSTKIPRFKSLFFGGVSKSGKDKKLGAKNNAKKKSGDGPQVGENSGKSAPDVCANIEVN